MRYSWQHFRIKANARCVKPATYSSSFPPLSGRYSALVLPPPHHWQIKTDGRIPYFLSGLNVHLHNDKELSRRPTEQCLRIELESRQRSLGPAIFFHQRVCDVWQPWQQGSGRHGAPVPLPLKQQLESRGAPTPLGLLLTHGNTCAILREALCCLSQTFGRSLIVNGPHFRDLIPLHVSLFMPR